MNKTIYINRQLWATQAVEGSNAVNVKRRRSMGDITSISQISNKGIVDDVYDDERSDDDVDLLDMPNGFSQPGGMRWKTIRTTHRNCPVYNRLILCDLMMISLCRRRSRHG